MHTLSPCLRFRTSAAHKQKSFPKTARSLSNIVSNTDLKKYIYLNRIHLKFSKILQTVKLDRDEVILANDFITPEENHTPEVWSWSCLHWKHRLDFLRGEGKRQESMGVIRCCLVKGQKVVQSSFQLAKNYKISWCVTMMEDGELFILSFKKAWSAHSAQCYRGHWQNVIDFEVILPFSQGFYLPSEQEDTLWLR